MICVTGSEATVEGLAARIRAVGEADLHEARLDLLEEVSPEAVAALPDPDRLIVTCRPMAEGGRFRGTAEEQRELLAAALAAGARYVDLEAAAPDATWEALSSGFGAARLVASLHRFAPTAALDHALAALLQRVAQRPAATLKLAVAIRDVLALEVLHGLDVGRPMVRIGMGPAGTLGRVRYEAMGSPWTYVTAPGTEATAPGQVSWDHLRAVRARDATKLLVLLGGEQVIDSVGPHVYERIAAGAGLPFYYLVAPTADAERALALLSVLGLAGASVTMPHKERAAELSRGLDDNAARLGAVNTLVPEGSGGWRGFNTDGVGVLGALAPQLEGGSKRIVVLGTGGAARAAVAALAGAGHRVRVVGRRPEAAAALARRLGGTPAPWDGVAGLDFDVLVNATPLGADGLDPVLHEPVDWRGKAVLDMLLHPRRTPLLENVSGGGGVAVPGIRMWVHQGAAQWRLLTGHEVSAAQLTALLPEPVEKV